MNLAGNVASSEETFTVTDGKLELNGATAPSGTIADKICNCRRKRNGHKDPSQANDKKNFKKVLDTSETV